MKTMTSGKLNDDKQQAFSRAMSIESEAKRVDALVDLAGQLEGEDKTKALAAALDTAIELPIRRGRMERIDRFTQHQLLIRLIPHLTDELRLKLRDAAQTMKDNHTRAWILTFLTPHLAGEVQTETFETALSQAMQIEDELARANTLSHLGPYIIGQDLDRVLTAVEAIKVKVHRPRVLASLVQNATEAQQERIFEAAMQLVDEWEEWYRAYVLRALVPHSIGDIQERAIEAILSLEKGEALADSFADVSDFLVGEKLEQALEKANAIRSTQYRAIALASLANRFSEPGRSNLIAQARVAAANVEDPQNRTQALVTVGRACEGQEQVALFAEALDAIVNIHYEEERYDEFKALIPDLPDALLEQARKVASTFGPGVWGDGARDALTERLNS